MFVWKKDEISDHYVCGAFFVIDHGSAGWSASCASSEALLSCDILDWNMINFFDSELEAKAFAESAMIHVLESVRTSMEANSLVSFAPAALTLVKMFSPELLEFLMNSCAWPGIYLFEFFDQEFLSRELFEAAILRIAQQIVNDKTTAHSWSIYSYMSRMRDRFRLDPERLCYIVALAKISFKRGCLSSSQFDSFSFIQDESIDILAENMELLGEAFI